MTAWKRAIAATMLVAGLSSCASTGSASSQATSPAAGSSGLGSKSPGDGLPSRPSTGNTTNPAGITSVPNVDSQPVPDAIQLLQQDDLTAGAQQQRANLYVPYMSVITTDPAVGSSEPDGSAVTLLVSAGPPSCRYCRYEIVQMPQLIGETLNQAITALAELGLSVKSHPSQPAPAPAGEVIASDPAPGQSVDERTGIELVLSSGLSSPDASPAPGITPSGF